jgi:hypothetical protein
MASLHRKMIRRTFAALGLTFTVAGAALCQNAAAVRFSQNPLIAVGAVGSLGDNINGPSVIRVPGWVRHPLGRYYMYFAHHKGAFIRLAYADSLRGPWKIYEPGVLNVRDSAFYRPQPDPPDVPTLYTHVASPEVYVDEQHKRFVLYVHGMWTDGEAWPKDPGVAAKWLRENGYAQYTQTAESQDGLHFQTRPGITAKTSYLRVFRWNGNYYGMGRLGVLGKSSDPLQAFELGPNPFEGGPYAGRVRHAATLVRGNTLHVFFSAIGDAPERILLSTIALSGDWRNWRASTPVEVLAPHEKYECIHLPAKPSKIGESEGPERALRDPALFEESGKVFLFYTVCGEQGIAGAELRSF